MPVLYWESNMEKRSFFRTIFDDPDANEKQRFSGSIKEADIHRNDLSVIYVPLIIRTGF